MHSGFAASRSCQNPSAQTLHTPFCNCCQSLLDTDTSPHTHGRTSIQEPKGKGFPGKGADQTETEQIPQRVLSAQNFLPAATPSLQKETSCLDQLGKRWSACAELLGCLAFYKYLFSEQTWFMASLTLHGSITAVGTVTRQQQSLITAGWRRSRNAQGWRAHTHKAGREHRDGILQP